jgi:hypothetical protein
MGGSKYGGGGGDGDQVVTVRYAEYLEEHHKQLLDTVWEQASDIMTSSPFGTFTQPEIEDAFFSAGYAIADFPSLYDMFGKFMAGLDLETLFTQIFDHTINNTAIDNAVSAHAAELSDDLWNTEIPKFAAGIRDINSVMSSTYIVAAAMMEAQRIKTLSKYDASLRHAAMPLATERFSRHLTWNKDVIDTYANLMKFYYLVKHDFGNLEFEYRAKDALWPLTVLEYYRFAVGTLSGATTANTDVAGASTGQKLLGNALSGAAAGYMVGGPMGGVIGGVMGAAAGLL